MKHDEESSSSDDSDPVIILIENRFFSQAAQANDPGAEIQSRVYLPIVLQNGSAGSSEKIYIPAGRFQMGCDPEHNTGSAYCYPDELPLHEVILDAYFVDKYEVTNARYTKCVEAGACNAPTNNYSSKRSSYFGNPAYADFPVIFVSWNDARNYCSWVGGHLPSEAEWEKASRSNGIPKSYPWGDQTANCSLANFSGGIYCPFDTSQTGYYPNGASPYGVLDLAGNVYEWVNDWYQDDYYSVSPRENPPGPVSGNLKVLRGGGWAEGKSGIRTAHRYALSPVTSADSIGFRCAYATLK